MVRAPPPPPAQRSGRRKRGRRTRRSGGSGGESTGNSGMRSTGCVSSRNFLPWRPRSTRHWEREKGKRATGGRPPLGGGSLRPPHQEPRRRQGDKSPSREGDDGQRSLARFPPSPRYLHLPQLVPLGHGGPASSPATLVAPSASTTVQRNIGPRVHPCWTYGPGRNQDKTQCH
jgi:hypothetical protein